MPACRPPVTLDGLAFRRIKIAFGVTTTPYQRAEMEEKPRKGGERERESVP